MQAEGQVSMNAAALALYEWTHEADLAAAGLLGALIEVAPQVGRPLLLTAFHVPLHSTPSASFYSFPLEEFGEACQQQQHYSSSACV